MGNNILGELLRHHDDTLQHYGKKGMKWGVRKAAGSVKTAVKKKANDVKDGAKKKVGDIKTRGAADKATARKRKAGEITRKQASKERMQNAHNYYMNNKRYKKSYEERIAKGQDPDKAMRKSIIDAQRSKLSKRAILKAASVPLSVTAIKKGKQFLSK